MSVKIDQPYPVFRDKIGLPLDGGLIYIGVAGLNPETNPIQCYFDEDFTLIAPQPLRTINGYISRNGSPANIFLKVAECSITIKDRFRITQYTDLNFQLSNFGTINSSSLFDESGLSQQKVNNGLESINELLAIPSPKNGNRQFVKSYHSGLNKGGGEFVFNSSKIGQNDGISVFDGWERIFSTTYVDFFQGGAIGDYSTDDNLAIERTQNYAREKNRAIYVLGNFATSKPFVVRSSDMIIGSRLGSRIKKITNQTSGLPDILAPEKDGVYDHYDVDALCIFLPYSGFYADNIVLRDVAFIRGDYGVDSPSTYGLYAPRHSSCETLNLRFDNVLNGFLAKNLFLNKHTNFSSVGATDVNGNVSNLGMNIDDGENVQTGTSNTFERFLFVNYKQAYFISNLKTSEFKCCYGEAISKAKGFDDTSIFFISNPYEISLNQCGLESSYGTPLYITAGNPSIRSKISVTGWQSRWGANGTLNDHGVNLLTILGNVDVTVNSATFFKAAEGFINDFAFVVNGAKLINNGSDIGTMPAQTSVDSTYIDLLKVGVSSSTKDVGADLNNGWENKTGLVVKLVLGATINIPSGLPDVYGTSEYFGLNSTQGTQILHSVGNQKSYRRFRTGSITFSPWVEI